MNVRRSYLSLVTPPTYYILVAVAARPLTAYDIGRRVRSDSDGAVVMATGSMTHALRRLVERGLLEKLEPESPRTRPRYRLTAGGRNTLQIQQKHHEHAAFMGTWALAGRSVQAATIGTLEI